MISSNRCPEQRTRFPAVSAFRTSASGNGRSGAGKCTGIAFSLRQKYRAGFHCFTAGKNGKECFMDCSVRTRFVRAGNDKGGIRTADLDGIGYGICFCIFTKIRDCTLPADAGYTNAFTFVRQIRYAVCGKRRTVSVFSRDLIPRPSFFPQNFDNASGGIFYASLWVRMDIYPTIQHIFPLIRILPRGMGSAREKISAYCGLKESFRLTERLNTR